MPETALTCGGMGSTPEGIPWDIWIWIDSIFELTMTTTNTYYMGIYYRNILKWIALVVIIP